MITDKTYSPVLRLTVQAAEELPAYRFVNFAGELCGAGEKALGVTDYPALSGEFVSLIVLGTAIIECSEAITAGAQISADAVGKGQVLGEGESSNGYAVTAASNDFATIILK
jgi:hypothetical protein